MTETRVAWPDVAKGISIVLVVVNHAGRGIHNTGIGQPDSNWQLFSGLSYAFMVPVFFYLSGWFAARSRRGNVSQCRRLLTHLVYPYFLWGTVQGVLQITTGAGNKTVDWPDLVPMLFAGGTQFWFLYILTLVYLIHLFFRILRIPADICVCIAFLCYIGTMFGFGAEWPPLRETLKHLIYFEIGAELSGFRIPQISLKRLLSIVFAGLAGLWAMHFYGAGYGTPLRLFSALFGIAGCLGIASLLSVTTGTLCVPLKWLGRDSLQIYVSHTIISAAVRVILQKVGIHDFGWHLQLGSLAGLVAPAVLAILDRRYCGWAFSIPESLFAESSPEGIETIQN